jgi:hypothetical protein
MAASASDMVDKADFEQINKEMAEFDEQRERVIKESRGAHPIGYAVRPC